MSCNFNELQNQVPLVAPPLSLFSMLSIVMSKS